MKLMTNSTPTALWHGILQEAQSKCSVYLDNSLETYLVEMLMRYTKRPEILKQIIAAEFLKGLQLKLESRQVALQEVGDKCLIYSGLFPHLAEKKMVKVSYFVNIGQSAYEVIAYPNNNVFSLLAEHFVMMMDILQSIRVYSKESPDLLPLEAYELWEDTGSKRALNLLKQYSPNSNFSIYK